MADTCRRGLVTAPEDDPYKPHITFRHKRNGLAATGLFGLNSGLLALMLAACGGGGGSASKMTTVQQNPSSGPGTSSTSSTTRGTPPDGRLPTPPHPPQKRTILNRGLPLVIQMRPLMRLMRLLMRLMKLLMRLVRLLKRQNSLFSLLCLFLPRPSVMMLCFHGLCPPCNWLKTRTAHLPRSCLR